MSQVAEQTQAKHKILRLNLHPGQKRVWESQKRMVAMLAGTQGGKTVMVAPWLHREIQSQGKGDYLAVTANYDLFKLKLLPELLDYFERDLGIGKYWAGDRVIEIAEDLKPGQFLAKQSTDNMWARIILRSAEAKAGLESATVKAAALDEAGHPDFSRDAWDAIQRRVSLFQGRVLFTTCYDSQTEIYTSNGWKLIGELTDTDTVYAPNEQGSGGFEVPSRRTWEHYKGKMLHFLGGRIDLCVTPNHRILYKNSSRFYIRDAEYFSKLKHRSLSIPKLIYPQGADQEWFVLPSLEKGHRWGKILCPEIKIPMPDWCAFMGWFLSEGHTTGCQGGSTVNGKYQVTISQSNKEKRETIQRDLAKLPFKWREEEDRFVTSDKQLWDYLNPLGDCYHKHIPSELRKAGRGNLSILIDRMVQGDGSYHKGGWFAYYTTSEQLVQDFREVCMLAGISTGVLKRENKGWKTSELAKPIYHIWQRMRKAGMVKQVAEIDYDGYIGCVGTSTGLVLVRRNGEECISGNTLYDWGWFKTEVYDRWAGGDTDYEVVQFDSTMNPAFPQAEFERAKRTLPEWKFELFYRGRYVRPVGMIYDSFNEHICKIQRFEISKDWQHYVGHDFGPIHTSALWYAQDPNTGYLYLHRTYLSQEKLTAALHVENWKEASRKESIRKRVGGAVGASDEGWREAYRLAGWPIAEPRTRNVEVGIDRVYGWHKANRLFVFEDLFDYLAEKMSYSRVLDNAYQPTEEIKDKSRYHLLDGERYVLSDFPPVDVVDRMKDDRDYAEVRDYRPSHRGSRRR